ncbi:cytochrome b [Aliiglaciecola sp. CAU 1673]|uniref:cytochrome b n=1 Tax=Aliiglaciecola sp. CAU 1673 TaxID=3032595 RepID=UPI0023DA1D6B|nr:cytochrome b [Aliiglaciecola sp. CAU 1673]MDF2177272.1 cytochrome b [Aliiglaciecola sp. CAU 1673]
MQQTYRYHSASIVLHWLMLILLVAVYACIELREFFERGSETRELFKHWHFMLGLSVGLLVIARLYFRLRFPTPPIIPTPPAWQSKLAKLVHGLLYLLMIGMPIGGWLILSGEAKPIPFFGLELPALMGPDKDLAHKIEEIHETVGKIGYFLIALHTVAALFHHYVVKDDTMLRMKIGK